MKSGVAKHLVLVAVVVCSLSLSAQTPKPDNAQAAAQEHKPAPAPPPSTTFEKTPTVPVPQPATAELLEAYPLPPEERGRIRDFQVVYDQLEIENQKMLVKVEQNKAQQSEVMNGIRQVAFEFSQRKQINLEQYELDAREVRFIKKKK